MLLARKLMVAGAGGFANPSDISSVIAWYDIQDPNTMNEATDGSGAVPSVGDRVARVEDQSGNGYHLTQATTADQPYLRQDGSGNYYLEHPTGNNGSGLKASGVDGSGATGLSIVTTLFVQSNAGSYGRIVHFSPTTGAEESPPWVSQVWDRNNNESFLTLARSGVNSSYSLATTATSYTTPTSPLVFTSLIDATDTTTISQIDGVQDATGTATADLGSWSSDLAILLMHRTTDSVFDDVPDGSGIYHLAIYGELLSGDDLSNAEQFAADTSGVTL